MKNFQILQTAWFVMLLCLPFNVKGDDMLKVGEVAPVFTLPAANGSIISLSDYRGKNYVVLFFYPGDETPGCTKQLCAARNDYVTFEQKNAVVFGINPGNDASHAKFIKRYSFPFTLLVDEGMKTAKMYGCGGIMVRRTVYVIDPQGNIVYAKRGMPPDSEIAGVIPEVKK